MTDEYIECSSPTGVTVGLIDSIITSAKLLRERDLVTSQAVRDALEDLSGEVDLLIEAVIAQEMHRRR